MSPSDAAQSDPQTSPPQENAKGSLQKSLGAAPMGQAPVNEDMTQDKGSQNTGLKSFILVTAFFSVSVNILLLVSPFYMLQVYDRVLTSGSLDTLLLVSGLAAGLMVTYVFAESARRHTLALAARWLQRRYGERLFNVNFAEARADGSLQKDLSDLSVVQSFYSNGMILPVFDLPLTPLFILVLYLIHPLLGWLGVGGAHGDLFTIDALTNELKFINAPDYESPVSSFAANSVVRIDSSLAERTIEQGENVITENPNSLVGNENGTLTIGEAVLVNGEDTSETFAGIFTLGGNEIIVTASAQADGTIDYNVYAPSGVDATTLSSSIPGDIVTYLNQAQFDLPETNDYQIVVEADEGGRTSTQTITITVEDVAEGTALPLSGFSLSTVKLDAELLEDLEGTVVSTPTDPAAPPTTPSTPQELTKLPAIDWVDDGFVAAQMQLDMSDVLDGF